MADRRRWTFAAFHTALLVAVGVWLGHLAGAVGDLLQGLNTAVGLGGYALLWAVGWLVTGRALASAPPATASGRELVSYGALYGAVTAVAFLLAALVLVGPLLVLRQGVSVSAVLLLGSIGTVAATIVGTVVGVIVAAIDSLLARAGVALARVDA